LVFGGLSSSYQYMDSVELFNWKTGQQCLLPPLPYAVYGQTAVVLNGAPVFCGGDSEHGFVKHCNKFEKSTKSWVQVSSLN